VQAVFDLGEGSFREGGAGSTTETDEGPIDPETEAVLEELRGTELAELSPIEVLNRVQSWQRRLDERGDERNG
jgi:DNA mismatch repair protein MutS